jgi:hypothetical protein
VAGQQGGVLLDRTADEALGVDAVQSGMDDRQEVVAEAGDGGRDGRGRHGQRGGGLRPAGA